MRPFTIALVASKGGVGKSVLATALAAHAVGAGLKVALVDMDAQGSLTLWHRMRGSPANPALLPEPSRSTKRSPYDVTIIDSPPSNFSVIERAIRACDVAVIPVRAGVFDLAAVKDVLDVAEEVGRHFLLVLNADEPHRKDLRNETLSALRKLGPTLGTPIENRAVYVTTLHHGKTGPEATDDIKRPKVSLVQDTEGAAEEIDELWKAILVVLKHARKS